MRVAYAYFVPYPRRIDDLRRPHSIEKERPYAIVKKITLAAIDYENFATDLLADRQFLEANALLCSEGKTMKCLLVCPRGAHSGILVVPDSPRRKPHVKWAAYASAGGKGAG